MDNRVSAIIINYNTAEMTEKAIRTLSSEEKKLVMEIILIDNGSKEPLNRDIFSSLVSRIIINDKNLGFAKAANQGIKAASYGNILLINSDVLVKNESIFKMLNHLEDNADIDVIGPLFLNAKKEIQPSAGLFPDLWREMGRLLMLSKILPGGTLVYENEFNRDWFNKIHDADWVSGGCMLVRKKIFEKIGLLDERFFFGGEDIDLCFRVKKAGGRVVYFPESEIIHYHGLSSGGRGSITALKLEADAMKNFFRINFPNKKFLFFMVSFLYFLKIKILNFFRN